MKRFTSLSILTLFTILSFQSCFLLNFRSVKGDKEITSKVYEIKDYTSIVASGSFEIIYEQKEGKPYLKVETDSNMFDYIDIDSDGTELNLDLDNQAAPSILTIYTNSPELLKADLSGSGSLNLKDSINVPNLSISSSGSHKVIIDQLETTKLKLDASGSSTFTINNLIANKFTVEGHGSTKIEAKGKVNDAFFDMAGSGKIEALDLKTQTTKCEISGSGSASLNCEKDLDISIAGSGSVKHTGNARVSQSIAGSGKVEKI